MLISYVTNYEKQRAILPKKDIMNKKQNKGIKSKD